MVRELLLPRVKEPELLLPSYVKLDMAFGVGSGSTLFDKSRYRSHGTITGASWATGLHGKCLDFVAATPSYVVIPATYTQLNFIAEAFSLIMRIKRDRLTTYEHLFIRGLANADGYRFLIWNDNSIAVVTHQLAASQTTRSSAVLGSTAVWYTVGFSRSGATANLYINGVLDVAIVGVHVNPLTSVRSAKIGVYDDLAGQPFDGKIEFCRIFGGIALQASEHLAWHNALA